MQLLNGHFPFDFLADCRNQRGNIDSRLNRLCINRLSYGYGLLINRSLVLRLLVLRLLILRLRLLISRLLTCYNGRNDELTEDDLSDLFLAYMMCCDERLALVQKLPDNKMKADDFVEAFMPGYLKSDGIESPRDYRYLRRYCSYC